MVLEWLSWRVTCQNHVSFRLLAVAGGDFCEPSRKLILLHIQSFVLSSSGRCVEFSSGTGFKSLDPFLSQQAGSMSHGHLQAITNKATNTYPSTQKEFSMFNTQNSKEVVNHAKSLMMMPVVVVVVMVAMMMMMMMMMISL